MGTTIGVPVSGHGITVQGSPNTDSTSSPSTIVPGSPCATIAALAHRDQVRRRATRVVEVVEDGHERAALLVQPRAEVEDLHLVCDVEERRRLVEQQQRRLLRGR